MYTVCGHAHPHHTRPNSAVSQKTVSPTPTSSSAKSSVSVGRNVPPKMWNRREMMSSRISGLPLICTSGSATKIAMSTYATIRRRVRNRPWLSFGLIHRRDPSSLSVDSTDLASSLVSVRTEVAGT